MLSHSAMIDALRQGTRPDARSIAAFASGLVDGSVTDAQAGAFAMAVCLNGLGEAGRVALTTAMRDSGHVMTWQLESPVIDKHSTGGVGDSVSLVLAPALVACGASVPMISGRGLGHTGGTLDKLEAIPGLSCELPEDRFRKIVGQVGCAIVAASADIAPADRRLYAIRNDTGTVPSPDLITASILSKKLAAGLNALVLDVKVGSGAFMASIEDAEALAHLLVDAANGAGCPTRALLTNMDEPLATSMGNALEVLEVMDVLTGEADESDLPELAGDLGGEVLALAGLADTPEQGAARVQEAIFDGRAAEIFGRMIAEMGGPADFLSRYADRLPAAHVMRPVRAPSTGFVTSIDGQALGRVVVDLGGGRKQAGDRIDPGVGLTEIVALGDHVDKGESLCMVHAATEKDADRAIRDIQTAMTLGSKSPDVAPLVLARLG